uniref:Gnk2-homologous domain-containing protein n=1 Tax=Kalanchoe fedtschenkoi TaxID=63787 RepID=A0A7N1A2Z8_KALFE
MPSIRNLILLLVSVLASFSNCITVFFDDGGYRCNPRPDNATSADFKTNLNSLLSALEEKAPDSYGFYAAAAGENPDRLYGLAQCRGDVSAPDCASCVEDSVRWATRSCNNSNEAAVWLDRCYLRYSDGNFLGQWNGSRIAMTPINMSTTDDPSVAAKGRNFMSLLAADAPNQPFLFEAGSVDVGEKGRRYGLVQCNRDLSVAGCRNCTAGLFKFYFDGEKRNQSSYRLFSYGCRMRYGSYKFYFNYTLPSDPPQGPPPPLPPPPSAAPRQLQSSFAVATVVMTVLLFLFSSSSI